MRTVIDTNIFISGLLGSGTCRKIFFAFTRKRFNLVVSEPLFDELQFVIERARLRPLIDNSEKKEMLSFIKFNAIFVRPKDKVNICRDIKDNKILECALEAKVDCIVTRDKDLLILKYFHNIPIISPKRFLSLL